MEDIEHKYPPNDYFAFVAMAGSHLNRDRTMVYNKVKQFGYRLVSYVSSKAFVWHNVKIGENCFILEDNTLQPFTEIGNNVVMWSGNHLGHQSKIKDNCFITSHVVISGFCTIGENTFMGVNSSVRDEVGIAKDNVIGMGAVITKNTEENRVYIGNPAKPTALSAKHTCKVEE